MIQPSQAGAVAAGKREPDKSHMGIRKRFMTPWKPCVESRRQARQNPKPVKPSEAIARVSAAKR